MVKEFLAKITKKQLIITGIVLGALLILGTIACVIVYNKRESLLASTIVQMQSKMADDYQPDLAIGKPYF